MTRALGRRVSERFKPASVLEYYEMTEAGAILDSLGALPDIDLVVAYGVPSDVGEYQITIAAVTPRARASPRDRDGTPRAAARGIPEPGEGSRPGIAMLEAIRFGR